MELIRDAERHRAPYWGCSPSDILRGDRELRPATRHVGRQRDVLRVWPPRNAGHAPFVAVTAIARFGPWPPSASLALRQGVGGAGIGSGTIPPIINRNRFLTFQRAASRPTSPTLTKPLAVQEVRSPLCLGKRRADQGKLSCLTTLQQFLGRWQSTEGGMPTVEFVGQSVTPRTVVVLIHCGRSHLDGPRCRIPQALGMHQHEPDRRQFVSQLAKSACVRT